MREILPGVGLPEVIGFLYVCENEGLNLTELAVVARLSGPRTTRIVKALSGVSEPWPALIEAREIPDDRRSRSLHLTPAGRDLLDRLDRIIAQAAPISQ
ncbi:hypothetical protein Q0812_04220 [Brevundimonas sp. 2R-24]|uniref:MarR family transcriptional regulator n=1 Tax=Peiella sedimenti TaxID=3061083 RepID=A0ABT8SLA2_9CAUL|nr:hypothetical protein [Caulobacteraceae bacterium XZ-24]